MKTLLQNTLVNLTKCYNNAGMTRLNNGKAVGGKDDNKKRNNYDDSRLLKT